MVNITLRWMDVHWLVLLVLYSIFQNRETRVFLETLAFILHGFIVSLLHTSRGYLPPPHPHPPSLY